MAIKKSIPENEILKSVCNLCDRVTNHSVLLSCEQIFDNDDGYLANHYWKIIQCRGCDEISFFKNYHDNEDIEYINEPFQDGSYYPIDHIEVFPPRTSGRKEIKQIYILPHNVRKIYEETLLAIYNKQHILAGIGIRAIIELICTENNAKGKNLKEKIEYLKQNSIISKEEEDLLHSSRLLGNISAHEVIPLQEDILDSLIEIIEHLLNIIYILPSKKEKLEKGLKKNNNQI